jgi:hypothetical protein
MGTWHDLRGEVVRFVGASGSPSIPRGAIILRIAAHSTSAGSVTFPNGVAGTGTGGNPIVLPLPASSQWFFYDALHLCWLWGNGDVMTFTSTDSYFVECFLPIGGT